MIVRDVMSAPAVTVGPDTPVKESLRLLDEHSITMLPVVEPSGRIVGVVGEADLIRDGLMPDLRRHLAYAPDELTALPPHVVAETMNPRPVTVHHDADLVDAVELMTGLGVKSLPVVDSHDRVVGVVSRRDVVRVLARPDLVIEADVDDLFRRLGLEWLVDVRDGVVTVSGPTDAGQRSMARAVAATIAGVVGVGTGARRQGAY